ncbi:MAG: hypothetical protein P4M11_15655 [Candidatus Pacebacteria bacterium]|nr:hypothetical protein [Candidatus Paceibacterota bacterium]
MKVSCIFVLFIIYAVLNIVYIVMFHSYAVKASNQYNDIQMRRPLMSEIVLMCRQAFFENDTHYLTTQTGSGIEYLPEYRNRLLTIEESLLDFEKSGPHFIFPGYIDKLSRYNSDQFCAELKPHITTSVNCSAYDSGFFKNGLRSTQFRYITFWQSLAQQFLKDSALSNAIELGTYQYNSDINRTSKPSTCQLPAK